MCHETEWWKDFFSGLALDLWRQAVTEEQTSAEAAFIERAIELPPKSKVLDVPSGNGRLSLALAARGYQLTGVDLAVPFLEEARSHAAERGLIIVFEERDMRDLPWQAFFDGAFCFGNSFGYLDDRGNVDFLKAVSGTLKPQARFILDASSCAELQLPRIKEHEEARIGDITFIEDNRYDHHQGRFITDYTFIREGKVEKKRGSHRIYTFRQVCEMLKETGFEVKESFGSLAGELFELRSHLLLIVAMKKG